MSSYVLHTCLSSLRPILCHSTWNRTRPSAFVICEDITQLLFCVDEVDDDQPAVSALPDVVKFDVDVLATFMAY